LYKKLVKLFHQLADILSASHFLVISMVKLLLHMVLRTMLKAKNGVPKEINMAKEAITKELARTYKEWPLG
jgi:hypothetical protein